MTSFPIFKDVNGQPLNQEFEDDSLQPIALYSTLVRLEQPLNAPSPIEVTELPMVTLVRLEQSLFVVHIDNQRVACNTVEKSYRGCFEGVKSCRFNGFNVI